MQFWKPGTAAPGSTADRESEAEGGLLVPPAANKFANLSLQAQRERLPIFRHRSSPLS
jgi:ATP-dependent RNA helicase DDX35